MQNGENGEEKDQRAPEDVRRLIGEWGVGHAGVGGLEGQLTRLVAAILEAAGRMNLTGDREPGLFWRRHVADAVQAAQAVEAAIGRVKAEARILDVGSGAGLPGLVWTLLWPAARVELVEARQKRAKFLEETAWALGMTSVRVHCGRAETLGHSGGLREQFDLIGARAVAALPSLLELTLPFAKIGGHVAAIKSADITAETKAAAHAAGKLGGGAIETISYRRIDGKPCGVCLVEKKRGTAAEYPRADGIPEHKPL